MQMLSTQHIYSIRTHTYLQRNVYSSIINSSKIRKYENDIYMSINMSINTLWNGYKEKHYTPVKLNEPELHILTWCNWKYVE